MTMNVKKRTINEINNNNNRVGTPEREFPELFYIYVICRLGEKTVETVTEVFKFFKPEAILSHNISL